MAIPAVNATYTGNAGPTASGQIVAFGGSDMVEVAYKGTATFVGDGATTTATLNLIDGAATLPFTPVACLVQRAGKSTDTAATTITASCASVSATTATVTFSAAPANAATITVVFIVFK